MIKKQLQQHIAKALKTLHEVESRSWHDILLTSINPIDEAGEAVKLIKIALGYKQFVVNNPSVDAETKREAYLALRAAYDNQRFPKRNHLNKELFEQLLDIHLLRL